MKRTIVVLAITALALFGPISGAWAADNQPSQGAHSTGRNAVNFPRLHGHCQSWLNSVGVASSRS